MVKVIAPLMSFEASGSVADFLTFSKRKSGQQVRWQKKQKDVITSLRSEQRNKFLSSSFASRFYECGVANCGVSVCGLDISDLNLEAKGRPMSGYNLAIKQLIDEF